MKIAIIGAGPAGLISAWQLAEQGHEITIFEKKLDLGAQGSGVLIQPVGLAALESLGIRQHVEKLGRKLNYIKGYFDHTQNQQIIEVDYGLLKNGFNYSLGINRCDIWSLLYEKIKDMDILLETGICINNLHYTKGAEAKDTSVMVIDTENKEHGSFDFIIDSSGANSKLRNFAKTKSSLTTLKFGALYASLKLPQDSKYNENLMTVYTGTHNKGVGLIPTGGLQEGNKETVSIFFNVAWQELVNEENNLLWDQASFESWKAKVLDRWPNISHLMSQITSVEQLYLAKFKQCTITQPYGKKIVFIGDAAHCSSPQLGQGINMSLVDSVVLAKSMKGADDVDVAIRKYAKQRQRHVWFYQSFTRLLTPFYQSGSSFGVSMRNFVFSHLIKLTLFKKLSTFILSGQVAKPLRLVFQHDE